MVIESIFSRKGVSPWGRFDMASRYFISYGWNTESEFSCQEIKPLNRSLQQILNPSSKSGNSQKLMSLSSGTIHREIHNALNTDSITKMNIIITVAVHWGSTVTLEDFADRGENDSVVDRHWF